MFTLALRSGSVGANRIAGGSRVFCQRCGSELLGTAAFCSICGSAAPSSSAPPSASQTAIPERSTRSKYVWLCVDIATFSFLLAIALFNLSWMTYASRFDEAEKSIRTLILVILGLAIPAIRIWKSILTLEPETDPLFKRKHKKFTSVATSCVCALLAVSLLCGTLVGEARAKQYAKDREISSLVG